MRYSKSIADKLVQDDIIQETDKIVVEFGLRQLFAVLRSLSIILDEATSALDNITQNEIMKNIKPLYQDKIVIIITHRLDTISDVDKIFVMSEGRICEEGQHNELMKKGEKYYALVQNL